MGPSLLQTLALLVFQALIIASCAKSGPKNSNLFREYLGAEFKQVTFSDVPINSGVEFHYILSFAIDYTTASSSPSPTNGKFNVFWDTDNLSPGAVAGIKAKHPNVKVALSLGGDSVGDGESAFFDPSSPETWISNAVSSLTQIIQEYNLDGIDVDYEHFKTEPDTFARCVGQLITALKKNGVVSFASIAPFDDEEVQRHYMALWKGYGDLIDYVNFQFYAYDEGTTVAQFLRYFDEQSGNYGGGKVLPSFISDGSGGLAPDGGFFTACSKLKSEGRLYGIFVWCADDSKGLGFKYEKQSQALLAISH
ncbi:chitinase 2-like [Salvia hispanica]|uniref:chitinase 2-like n=1 Tax=Salvia hispanica TaxID=49212 RepID=UPI0020091EC0|nr:chitinase 2-like [Salvia hispanica]XP_047979367.1 chitinase 2-like [Salvia hispanica]